MNPVSQLEEASVKLDCDSPSTILLLGNRRQSLTVIRSLAAQGWRVIAAVNRGDDRNYHAHRSRFVAESWEHDDYRLNLNLFVSQLMRRLLSAETIHAIFPVDEAAIRCLDGIRNQLPTYVKLVMANARAVETCLDKPRMFEVCNNANVPFRRYEIARGESEVRRIAGELGFPLIIKPIDEETISFGVKAEIVKTETQLESLAKKLGFEQRRLMIQEYATGPRHNVYFAAVDGKLVAAAEVKIGRTDRKDGTGLAVSGETIEPTRELWQDTTSLCFALRYHGVGCAQFLVDPATGERTFLELNPRLGANFAAVDYAGLHLANLAVEIASGTEFPLPIGEGGYRVGKKFAWTYGDLAGCRFEYKQGKLTKSQLLVRLMSCFKDAIFCNKHITMSWSDPVPTGLEFARGCLTKSRVDLKKKAKVQSRKC